MKRSSTPHLATGQIPSEMFYFRRLWNPLALVLVLHAWRDVVTWSGLHACDSVSTALPQGLCLAACGQKDTSSAAKVFWLITGLAVILGLSALISRAQCLRTPAVTLPPVVG